MASSSSSLMSAYSWIGAAAVGRVTYASANRNSGWPCTQRSWAGLSHQKLRSCLGGGPLSFPGAAQVEKSCGKKRREQSALRGRVSASATLGAKGDTAGLPSWEQLQDSTAEYFEDKKPREGIDRKVTLYRDTNAWCPFCTRVWLAMEEKGIRYDTVLIDLYNKPQWYKDMVPTSKVPAVDIEGRLVWESTDILWLLDQEFPNTPPLIPQGREPDVRAVLAKLDPFLNAPFFTWIFNAEEEKDVELKEQSLAALDLLESTLAHKTDPGPFLLGQFSLADTVIVTPLEGISHRIEFTKKFAIRGNSRYPHITAWLDALDLRPSYQAVKADSRTANLVLNYFVGGMTGSGNQQPPLWGSSIPFEQSHFAGSASNGQLRTESGAWIAAARMSHNKEKVVQDCMRSAGVRTALGLEPLPPTHRGATPATPPPLPAPIQLSIDAHLRLLNLALLLQAGRPTSVDEAYGNGATSTSLLGVVEEQLPEAGSDESKAGVAAIKHIMDRVCVPRDMTAGSKVVFLQTANELIDALATRKAVVTMQ